MKSTVEMSHAELLDFQSHSIILKLDISPNLVAIDSANNVSSAASHSADCCDHTPPTCWNSVHSLLFQYV